MKGYNVAVVGATGAVGREMVSILEQRQFPINNLILIASERSKGKTITFKDEELTIKTIEKGTFSNIDIALFSIGSEMSKHIVPQAVNEGAIVIDNSNAFRMAKDVPLVVPEINPDAINKKRGIIANPNCSTIQLVLAINPIHKKHGIKRMIVSTYQAVSGTGRAAIEEMKSQIKSYVNKEKMENEVYPHQIAFNVLPHIDVFDEDGYTREERKVVRETKKILEDNSINITCTAARVPVFYGHAESVNIELKEDITVSKLKKLISLQEGILIHDDPTEQLYPHNLMVENEDRILVGRIRRDFSRDNSFNLWIVGNNLRKGAALNAVQIAEKIV